MTLSLPRVDPWGRVDSVFVPDNCRLSDLASCCVGVEDSIHKPTLSRKGLSPGASNLSLITASGFKSPTKRSVLCKDGSTGSADAVLVRVRRSGLPAAGPDPVALDFRGG